MAELADVIIVGAGPAGSAAALGCARRRLGRVLLLDRADFPRRKVCASGLSPRARRMLRRLGLWHLVEPEAYSIRGVRLVSPNGQSAHFVGADAASVLVRARFDQILADAAVGAGAEFRPATRVLGLLRDGERIAGVTTEAGEIEARWVINAGGANVRLDDDPRPRCVLKTCMAWYEGVDFTPHVLEMIFDPELLPHYGWLFPETAERVNLGLCIDAERLQGSVRDLFQRFLDRHYAERLSPATQLGRLRGHPISTSTDAQVVAAPGLLPVGEAARLVNVATGEGIAYALESGELAAATIASGFYGGVCAERVAADYVAQCRQQFRINLMGGELFRRHGVRALNSTTRFGQSWLMQRATNQALLTLTH